MIAPIPVGWLIHSIIRTYDIVKDKWGAVIEESEDDVITSPKTQDIIHVRVEPSKKIVKNKENKDVQLHAILFYDALNSSPREIDFQVEDQITFNDSIYNIEVVEPLYDDLKIHHLEIGLS